MVIKNNVFNKRFEFRIKLTTGLVEQYVNFYITIQQLAIYLNDSYVNWEVSQQLVYLQAIYDNWSIDLYDSLFTDDDFVKYMYQSFGFDQLI